MRHRTSVARGFGAVAPMAVAIAAWLAVPGCGGDDTRVQPGGPDATADQSPDTGGADSSIEVAADASTQDTAPGVDGGAGAAFCQATYGAQRVAFEGCCLSGDVTTNQYKFIDQIYLVVAETCATQLSRAIDDGRVTFDPNAAQSCVASIGSVLAHGWCWSDILVNQPRPPLFASPACDAVVTGLQGSGAPCAVDFECQNGLTCVGWSGSADGTCQTAGGAGQPCEQAAGGQGVDIDYGLGNHPRCASGAYCVSPTCKAQGGSGASCTRDVECTSGSTCHLGQCGSGSPAAQNGPCTAKIDCQEGLYCQPGDGGALPGSCQSREPAGGGGCTGNGDQCKGYCAIPDGGTTGLCTAVCGSG